MDLSWLVDVIKVLAGAGLGGVVTNALRSRASKSKEKTEALVELWGLYNSTQEKLIKLQELQDTDRRTIDQLTHDVKNLTFRFRYLQLAVRERGPVVSKEIFQRAQELAKEAESEGSNG